MNLLRLSLKFLHRDWRAGEWRVLLLALVLAVGSLATVGLFADRVRQALAQQATSLIGADLRITSTRVFPVEYRALAQGLRVVESRTFPSMVAYGEQVLLSEIQAVQAGYPLRGKIEVDDVSNAKLLPQPSSLKGEGEKLSIPPRGTVWVDSRLMTRSSLQLGDEVGIGARQFRVAARIVKDVDQSIGFASFAPRVLMNEADLASTGLLQEGSRISYRMMFAGDAERIKKLRDALQTKLAAHEKLEDVRDARPEIRAALERAENFLGLAALTAAMLAGAAMSLAARRFVLRHLDGCAVMRCLGAQQAQLLGLFFYQLLLVGMCAAALGGLLGYATQAILVESMAAMREANLPPPSFVPLAKAALSGLALLIGFAFVPLLQLRNASPQRVLRRELAAPEASVGIAYSVAGLVLAGLFVWQAGSWQLGLMVLGGVLAALILFAVFAQLLLRGLAHYAAFFSAPVRMGVLNLARHGAALQIVALSLGGMALLVLTVVRADLLASWQGKLPVDAPNRFVVNIQPDQQAAVQAFFARNQLAAPELLPMVRGRLLAINARQINANSFSEPRAQALVEREFNLSYREEMPSWNELVAGRWWRNDAQAELSVEQGIATTLGIKLGDTLTYDVAGSVVTARVSSLRRVAWDSMKVNFFVITSPAVLRDMPASYLASVYLPPDKLAVSDALVREFPNLLVIDTGSVIAQVQSIIAQIAQTVSAVFLFTLLGGLLVLYAALLATQDERAKSSAILRTLGATSMYLRRLHTLEFALLGAISGAFAAAGASLIAWVVARWVLEIPYQFSLNVWLI
ncbi:MAG: ABC transporter permease, partial [Gallionella sp.]